MIVRWMAPWAVVMALLGCAGTSEGGGREAPAAVPAAPVESVSDERVAIPSPDVWGGEARCSSAMGCQWVAVEHETSHTVLYRWNGRQPQLVSRVRVAYHPDGAKWLDDRHVVAAVEEGGTLDVFSVDAVAGLKPVTQIPVGFSPRDVTVWPAPEGGWYLLATPYGGDTVAWAHWQPGATPKVLRQTWCPTPWHAAPVARGPGGAGAGVVTACHGDKTVRYGAFPQPLSWEGLAQLQMREVGRFGHIPRRVEPSPDGRHWYVALETGDRVARLVVGDNQWQMLPIERYGAVGVAPLDDGWVAWGENGRVLLYRYDEQGRELSRRALPTAGFPDGLQWADLDRDGRLDLIVMNSAGQQTDVYFAVTLR